MVTLVPAAGNFEAARGRCWQNINSKVPHEQVDGGEEQPLAYAHFRYEMEGALSFTEFPSMYSRCITGVHENHGCWHV